MKIKGGDDYNSSRSVAWPARGKDPVVMYAAHGSVVIRANPLVKRQMRHRKHVLLVTNPQGVSNARCVLPATGSLLTPLRDGRLSSPKSAAEGVAEAPHGVWGLAVHQTLSLSRVCLRCLFTSEWAGKYSNPCRWEKKELGEWKGFEVKAHRRI